MIIKFACPHCQQPMEGEDTLYGQFINCPGCLRDFAPIAPASPAITAKPAPRPPAAAQLDLRDRVDDLRRQGSAFTAVAVILFALAAFICFATFITHLGDSDHDSATGYIASGSLLSLSLWLYLVAQIIHIRANTEK
jgi:hypothetical protein